MRTNLLNTICSSISGRTLPRYRGRASLGVLCALLGTACSKGTDVTCGEGTVLEGDTCVAAEGLGGSRGVDDPDERAADIALVKKEFLGARAAGPSSDTSALVVWDLTSVSDVTFNIYVSTDEDDFSFGTPQFTAPAGATSWDITGLTKGVPHFIVVRAVVGDTEVVPPDDKDSIIEVIPENDGEAPSFAGASTATSGDNATVILEWDAASDDLSPAGALTYLIYMDFEPGLGADEKKLTTPFAISPAGATRFEVNGLPAAETEYFFVVRARDAAGNIDDNTIEISGTSGPDVKAPSFAGCELATARSASALDVFWTQATDDVTTADKIAYNLYVSEQADGHNFSTPAAQIVGGNTGTVEGLDKDTKYYVICRAEDPSGNIEQNLRTASATTKEDDQPPVFGGIQLIESITAESMDFAWTAATDNQSVPANMKYLAFLATTEEALDLEGAPTASSLPGAAAMTVPDLLSDTAYFAVVLAEDEAGNRSVAQAATKVTTFVSLRNDISVPIFSTRCANSGCHNATDQAGQMSLTTGFEYAQIVGVAKATVFGTAAFRISPNSVANSVLIERLELPNGDPNKMPASLDIVSPDEIDRIKRWINQGATNN